MASQILATASNVAEKAKEMTSAKNVKVAQLAADTKDVHDKSWKMTTDYGVKQNNTDDWLKVATEDKQGPLLLEDHFGREKVGLVSYCKKNQTLTTIDPSLRPRTYSRACRPRPRCWRLRKVHVVRVRCRCYVRWCAYRHIT
jgi:hypothetical protein